MVRAYLSVRATGGAVFPSLRGGKTKERWSPFKGEGDGGCSKIRYFSSFKNVYELETRFCAMQATACF